MAKQFKRDIDIMNINFYGCNLIIFEGFIKGVGDFTVMF